MFAREVIGWRKTNKDAERILLLGNISMIDYSLSAESIPLRDGEQRDERQLQEGALRRTPLQLHRLHVQPGEQRFNT